MEVVGVIGGMSWESTHHYYEIMNRHVSQAQGGLNSVESITYSINFASIEDALDRGDWSYIANRMTKIAKKLEDSGATFLIITSNAIHMIADEVQSRISIPILHIVDPTAQEIKNEGISTVGLLGTKVTMEQEFYRRRLHDAHGIDVIIPDKEQREIVHRVIFEELVTGKVDNPQYDMTQSREAYKDIIEVMAQRGAQAVILGCTEINMLITQKDTGVKLLDTTELHARAAADMYMNGISELLRKSAPTRIRH